MDPNKEIDDLEEIEESEGLEEETNDEEFEPELDSDSDEKIDIEDNDLDEEVGDNEVIVDTDDDASIYDDDASDVVGDDNDSDIDNDIVQGDALEDSIIKNKDNKKTKSKTTKQTIQINSQYSSDYDSDEEDDYDDDENYLQKFSKEINKQYIEREHPECIFHNYNEISALTKVIRDKNNNIIDPLHRTVPFLTKYEKTRIIGQRAKQINSGAKPFVNVPQHIIDGYIIAELELKQKKIPFIIKRPIPGGGSEYWNVKDLELI
jgi:DNA-directed RNA polymerase I, II, and III subunit RPABC2